jgi:hypothetical protein
MKCEERPNGWNENVRPKPKNIFEIDSSNINLKDFDILLTQSQGQNLKFRGNNSIKKINLEHTYPMTDNLKIDVDEVNGKNKSMFMVTAIATAVLFKKEQSINNENLYFKQQRELENNDKLEISPNKKIKLNKNRNI